MISSLFYFCWRCLMFLFNILKLFYVCANATSLQIVFAIALLICVLRRYFRLKQPNLPKNIEDAIRGYDSHPTSHSIDINNQLSTDYQNHRDSMAMEWWPIANRAACLDSVENSRTAIEKCVAESCRNILLDVDMTKCGQLVILHKQTLHRLEHGSISNGSTTTEVLCSTPKLHGTINAMKFVDLKHLNVAANHPLCDKHPTESVLHFNDLMQLLDGHEKLNVFLLMGTANNRIVAVVSRYFENNPERFKRIIICSRSPFVIYKLRKQNPQLICGLWLDKMANLKLPTILLNSTFFSFIYGLLFRNIIAVITGISAVFINKNDFNVHLGQMWRQSNIQTIIYTLNSPSEKRYVQQTLRTQYLTDSLRSEPYHFVTAKK